MSSQFDSWIHHLLNNPDSATRAKAAETLAEYVESLDEDQYATALAALNQAMTDPDPMVLMTVMSAMGSFDRHNEDFGPEEIIDSGPAVQASACRVCGKPEALVDVNECEYPNCPYK
jgi:hypothetical protein